MRWLLPLWSCLAGCLATPGPAAPRRVGKGTIATARLHSAALGEDRRYLVYLPAGYSDSTARYPVIYLLHGAGGDESSWVHDGGLVEAADHLQLQALVVMPDGDDAVYVNRYEDYIVEDLVAHVDANWRTIPARRGRAIGGAASGGTGALVIALRHKDRFASAASHSGLVALLYQGPHPYDEAGQVVLVQDVSGWGSADLRAAHGDDVRRWREHDPAWLAPRLRDGELSLYLDCGTEDDGRLDDGAEYLHHLLVYAGIKHRFALVHGGHDWTLWKRRIGDSLSFHVDEFRKRGL